MFIEISITLILQWKKKIHSNKELISFFFTFILTGIGFPVNVIIAVIIITLSIRHDASVTAR